MLREVAEAEDGPASVISAGLNLGLPSPDTDTICSCHRPPSHLSARGGKPKKCSSGPEGCCLEQSSTRAMEMMKIFEALKETNKQIF